MKPRLKLLVGVSILLSSYLVLHSFYALRRDTLLHLKVLDVGQGDSLLVKFPHGEFILVDGGPDPSLTTKLLSNLPPGPCVLKAVVLTHPHSDHLAGLIDVVKLCTIETAFTTEYASKSFGYEKWLKALAYSKSSGKLGSVVYVYAGDSFEVDGVVFQVLWPPGSKYVQEVRNANYASIVLLLKYRDFSALLTGDAEASVYYSGEFSKLRSPLTLLKAPHHGSIDSLNKDFFEKIKPGIVVVSVGAGNNFGHPSPVTLSYYASLGSRIYRTDHDGDVDISTDGQNVWVRPGVINPHQIN